MGCDGGTIPKRDELVRIKKKPEQKDKDSELSYRWRHCSITQQPLQKPIVACGLGRLYSKISVIEGLLDRSSLPETARHIRNLKDVKELILTPNPAFKEGAEKGDGYVDRQCAPHICPVIGIEMNGKFKFSFIWSCGCVMSERALKEIKTKVCHKCQKPFGEEDVVVLNPEGNDADLMATRMEARLARAKLDKKLKKAVKVEPVEETVVNAETSETKSPVADCEIKPTVAVKTEISDKAAATSGKLVSKLPKAGTSHKRGSDTKIEDPDFKKAKGSYSVAKDPNASDVYKSLFTSHQKAQSQTRAHWITYNPFYN
ncbi:replication termination factor 2 [Macrosteles quadrilineatus]|uniref:replication termination factor 2 n=1 Tax=Macrosteles quadrilineatus TaxID=74068 RepID=UPI0023E24995|nr:replication termination factor 2 [Macrosteles quadrilineatus]